MHTRATGLAHVFARAAAFHAQGRLREAEQLYENVLAAEPRHFESLYRLGLIRLHQGRFIDAEPLFRRAVKLDKHSADAQHHLAIALTGLQHLEEAILRYEKALALRPGYAEVHNNIGHTLQMLGRHEQAATHYQQALAIDPGYFQARNNFGNALAALDRNEDAIVEYRQALATNPAYPEACNNLASALSSLGRYAEAVPHCEQALRLRPDYVEARINLANALAALGRPEQAIRHYEQALAFDPAHVEARIRLAHTLLLLDRSDEALGHCEHMRALNPNSHQALHDLGTLLWKLQRREESLACYDRALAIRSDFLPALVNRGNPLKELRRFEEALASYARALALQSDCADAHLAESLVRLSFGDFRLGLEKYEWRRKTSSNHPVERRLGKPIWLGSAELAGKTLLASAEQGFGDTLQFCRYAELLAEKGAKVILEVQPALKSLLGTLRGIDRVVAIGEPLPDFDFWCPIPSLAFAFKTTVDTIPARTPYLSASPELIARWEQKLGPRKKLRVGLVWSGNPNQVNDHTRSIPLADFLPWFLPSVELFSLQKEVRVCDLQFLKSRGDLIHFGDALGDFSDTAALVSCMDLVISVCTSVGHLAGALNKPTWFLLSDAADWRWLQNRNDSPWYPSARLFRQPKIGDWASVIQEVAAELASCDAP
jgi:tetratricopeptide (TPR) repeat protein